MVWRLTPENFKIGIEHEKFLFNTTDNKRIDYSKIKEMFSALLEFGWNPVFEKENIIALNKGGKNITLEPGNQIELSGDKLTEYHNLLKLLGWKSVYNPNSGQTWNKPKSTSKIDSQIDEYLKGKELL